MNTTRKVYLIGLMIALLLAMVGSTAMAQRRTGNRPDAPKYGVRGLYTVGTVDMQIEDEERPINLTVWYPADASEGFEGDYTYTGDYSPVGYIRTFGKASLDALPDSENGPYPLVIYSHGHSGFRFQATYFTEHLASWGFIVMALDHPDMFIANSSDDYVMYATTPQDVSRVIDFAEAQNEEGMFAGLINTDKIGMTGQSSGGFTALQAVGGQLDLSGMLAECEANSNHFDCPYVMPSADKIAELYGVDGVTDELLPPAGDERIDAVIPMSPDQMFFGEAGLNNVTIPTLYIAGDIDTFVPYEDITRGFASLGSEIAYMATFENAGHGISINTCEQSPIWVEWNYYYLCEEIVWDKARAHDLINHFGTAFLLWQLSDEKVAGWVFTQNQADFVGVEMMSK